MPTMTQRLIPLFFLLGSFIFFKSYCGFVENLGGLGAVFAHELGHGIDDKGSKFDSMSICS